MTSSAREAVAVAIIGGLGFDVWEYDGTAKIYEGDIDPAADAVIAHLWQASDDPEVVEAMYVAFIDRKEGGASARGLIRRSLRAGLTALLGPRRQEGDDDAN